MNAIALNPSIVGQTEKAHSSLLALALAGTGVDEKQWITLNLAMSADAPASRAELIDRVGGLTGFTHAVVAEAIDALVAAGRLTANGDRVEPSEDGTALAAHVRATTGPVVERAYGAVSADELAVAARVLTTITARLREELAALGRAA